MPMIDYIFFFFQETLEMPEEPQLLHNLKPFAIEGISVLSNRDYITLRWPLMLFFYFIGF